MPPEERATEPQVIRPINVARYFYGNDYSYAPGANTATIYETSHWLSNVLKMSGGTPATHDFRVESYSWVGSYGSSTMDAQALGRFDYLIDNNTT